MVRAAGEQPVTWPGSSCHSPAKKPSLFLVTPKHPSSRHHASQKPGPGSKPSVPVPPTRTSISFVRAQGGAERARPGWMVQGEAIAGSRPLFFNDDGRMPTIVRSITGGARIVCAELLGFQLSTVLLYVCMYVCMYVPCVQAQR